jgi:hypothetical protein
MHASFGSDVSILVIYMYTALHSVCMTSYIISTYIQHQPTNLYCVGMNSLAMVYCMVQKQINAEGVHTSAANWCKIHFLP